MEKVNIKTTSEIKKGNDYRNKLWVEVSDISLLFLNFRDDLNNLGEEFEQKAESLKSPQFEEEQEQEETDNDKYKQLSQRVYNFQQSNEANKKKIDRVYGEITDKLNSFSNGITEINDKLKVLEKAE
jgi:HD superfamily phosphohydrolase